MNVKIQSRRALLFLAASAIAVWARFSYTCFRRNRSSHHDRNGGRQKAVSTPHQ